jgi:hypothetical protein
MNIVLFSLKTIWKFQIQLSRLLVNLLDQTDNLPKNFGSIYLGKATYLVCFIHIVIEIKPGNRGTLSL